MNWIRTTISVPEDVYENIRRLAFNRRMSINQVINQKLAGGLDTEEGLKKKAKDGWDYLTKLSKLAGSKTDAVKAVREMRDHLTYG